MILGLVSYLHIIQAGIELMIEYAKYRTDLIACTQLTTPSYAVYVTSNPSVASSISAKSTIFLKPIKMFRYVAINVFGLQLVSTQTGVEHRRHRNVVKHCFNEEIMETSHEGMVNAIATMIKEEKLQEGGVFEDTRIMMIKVSSNPPDPHQLEILQIFGLD
jgi:cytochrome P450